MGPRMVGFSAVALVALTACSGGGGKGASPANSSVPTISSVATNSSTAAPAKVAPTSTTARQAPKATTPTPEYSFDNSVPPPPILDTGTNYAAIAASLGAYGNWLGAHRPDPVLAKRILAPGSEMLNLFSRDLTRLRDNRKRLIEKIRAPARYTVINSKADAASLRVRESILLHETVNSEGTVTSLAPFPQFTDSLVLLVQMQGFWRVAAWDPLQPPPNVHI